MTRCYSFGKIYYESAVVITILAISYIVQQTLKIGGSTIYIGAGSSSAKVTVERGSIITISAVSSRAGYVESVITPVTASSSALFRYFTSSGYVYDYYASFTYGVSFGFCV